MLSTVRTFSALFESWIVHESGCELLADSEVFIQVWRGPDESDGAWLLLAWNLNKVMAHGSF
jgi:hypothetical protein